MPYNIISKKTLPKSLLELDIEIPWESLSSYEAQALSHMREHVEAPGFRKGNVPLEMVRQRVGDMALLEEMSDAAMGEAYPEIVEKEGIAGVGRPQVVITKLGRGNPLAVRITVAVLPEVTLPDYKKIAAGIKLEKAEVTDADVDDFIENIRKNFARETHSYAPDHNHTEGHRDEDLILPTLDDEFVKKLGAFENLEDFRVKMRENLINDKDIKARGKRRAAIAEALLAATEIEVPEILIEAELERMFGQMETDISSSGLRVEDYLKHIQKTKQDILGEWQPDAKKRAALELLAAEIAKKENIKAHEEKVKPQYDAILAAQPDVDPMRVKMYLDQVFTNEAVFDFLEAQK